MKEKKHGKLIFGIIVLVVLALQPPIRNGVYHFFTRNNIINQVGVKQKTQNKVVKHTENIFDEIKKEVEKILDNLKKSANN